MASDNNLILSELLNQKFTEDLFDLKSLSKIVAEYQNSQLSFNLDNLTKDFLSIINSQTRLTEGQINKFSSIITALRDYQKDSGFELDLERIFLGHEDHLHDDFPVVDLDHTDTSNNGSSSNNLAVLDLNQTFSLQSNPNAKHTIYLDFDGHATSGTIWNSSFNNSQDIITASYDTNGDINTFTSSELQNIQWIWQRVAEDFSPFDVNVTTQDPGTNALTKSGSGDTEWGIRVVIGGSSDDWYGNGAGGVAYLNSFNWSNDTPVFVFEDKLGNGNEKYTAEAVSHEVGHALGLNHDGTSTTSYYSGSNGWASIMGVGYYQELTQWSKGEYADADNKEDDLAIIAGGGNGFGYRRDDYGDSLNNAAFLATSGGVISSQGIIEQSRDYDFFSFYTDAGNVSFNILPAARGANLDILAQVYDSSGSLIATSNSPDSLTASFDLNLVTPGQYYLAVTGTGKSGVYSDYGSLGQYKISGDVIVSSNDFISIQASNAVKSEGNSGTTADTFTVSRSGDVTSATSVEYTVSPTLENTADSNDFVAGIWQSGIVEFTANETTKLITIEVAGDIVTEANEDFLVSLSNPSNPNTIIASATAVGTIINDDIVEPTNITISDVTTSEGTGIANITVTRSGNTIREVTLGYSTADGGGKWGAKNGIDYIAEYNQTIKFATNQTQQVITIDLIDDSFAERTEKFYVNLSSSDSDVNVFDSQAQVSVTDDDSNGKTKGGGKGKKAASVASDLVTGLESTEVLVGGASADILVKENTVSYAETGLYDYGVIENFDKSKDTIELYGAKDEYILNSSPFNPDASGIYFKDELIAVIENEQNLNLNSSNFDFFS